MDHRLAYYLMSIHICRQAFPSHLSCWLEFHISHLTSGRCHLHLSLKSLCVGEICTSHTLCLNWRFFLNFYQHSKATCHLLVFIYACHLRCVSVQCHAMLIDWAICSPLSVIPVAISKFFIFLVIFVITVLKLLFSIDFMDALLTLTTPKRALDTIKSFFAQSFFPFLVLAIIQITSASNLVM